MRWEKVILGELINTVKGFAFKSTWFVESGTPVVKVKDFTLDSISVDSVEFISIELENKFLKYQLQKNDVIIQTVGSWASNPNSVVGKVIRVPESLEGALLNQNAVKLECYENLDRSFLFYRLKNSDFKGYIIGTAQGAANQASITLESIRKFSFHLPPLPTQQRTASILSAYDDLIENNTKRIKLLEEAAQNIYKEWFVHFRFPGYEKAKFKDGLPVSWKKENLYDLVEVQMGYSFKGDAFNDKNIGQPVVRIRDIPNQWTNTYSTEEAPDNFIIERGDILIGMDGFFYLDIWAGQRAYLVQRVCRIRAYENKMQGYILEGLREPIKYYESTIMGATVAHLGAKHLKEINIIVPDNKHQYLYDVFNSLSSQKLNLLAQNQKLREARDILLPRLMNRTIEVGADAELEVA